MKISDRKLDEMIEEVRETLKEYKNAALWIRHTIEESDVYYKLSVSQRKKLRDFIKGAESS